MLKYVLGLLKHIFNSGISYFALIDYESKIDRNAQIYRGCKVYKSTLGAYSYLAPNSNLTFAIVGKYCSIGPECIIGLANHSFNYISSSPIFTSPNNANKKKWTNKSAFNEFSITTIGNDVWIGSRVIIKGGISIGDGVVIGAGSIVTKDIPPYSIVAGIPAKVIKYRFNDEMIKKLLQLKWWDISEVELRKRIHHFQLDHPSIEDLNFKY